MRDAGRYFAFAFWQLGHPDYQPKGNSKINDKNFYQFLMILLSADLF